MPGDEDLDTPTGTTARRRSGVELWSKLNARGQRVRREQTLSRAFMRNFEKLAKQIRTESTSENSPVQLEAGMKENFRHLERKSLHTIVKMAKDSQVKDHILKRSKEARRKWHRGFAKLRGGKFQLMNLVQEATEKKEEEEMERLAEAERAAASAAAANYLTPVVVERPPRSPASSQRSDGRRRQQVPGEGGGGQLEPDIALTDFPGYVGGSPRLEPRFGSRRGSARHSGRYDESGEVFETSEIFKF